MTGGAFKNSSNLLGRRREIEELEQTCERYLKQAETIQTELSLKEAIVQEKKDEAAVLKKSRTEAGAGREYASGYYFQTGGEKGRDCRFFL